jgi:hypothetical protein
MRASISLAAAQMAPAFCVSKHIRLTGNTTATMNCAR